MLSFLKKFFTSADDEAAIKDALKNKAFLVDVRTRSEFSDGTAGRAVNIPLSEIQSKLSKFKGKKEIVVFCRSGSRSAQAKRILENNGFENVYNGGSVGHVRSLLNS